MTARQLQRLGSSRASFWLSIAENARAAPNSFTALAPLLIFLSLLVCCHGRLHVATSRIDDCVRTCVRSSFAPVDWLGTPPPPDGTTPSLFAPSLSILPTWL